MRIFFFNLKLRSFSKTNLILNTFLQSVNLFYNLSNVYTRNLCGIEKKGLEKVSSGRSKIYAHLKMSNSCRNMHFILIKFHIYMLVVVFELKSLKIF